MASRLGCIVDWDLLAGKAGYNARQLASICQVSIRNLERFFKQSVNSSPQAWLNRLRLTVAQDLLMQGLSVKETTYRLGFKQPSHFCRQFRLFTGVTPSTFQSFPASSLTCDVAAGSTMAPADNSVPLTHVSKRLTLDRVLAVHQRSGGRITGKGSRVEVAFDNSVHGASSVLVQIRTPPSGTTSTSLPLPPCDHE